MIRHMVKVAFEELCVEGEGEGAAERAAWGVGVGEQGWIILWPGGGKERR